MTFAQNNNIETFKINKYAYSIIQNRHKSQNYLIEDSNSLIMKQISLKLISFA